MKTCTKCKKEQPFSAFHKSSSAKDGYQYHCKACKLAFQQANPNRAQVSAKYRAANKELCNARSVASQAKRKDYYNAKMRKWCAENREQHLATRKAWYAANRAADIERVRRRAGRIREAENRLTQAEKAEVQAMYDFCRVFPVFEVDHIIPLNGEVVSGLHVPTNLQILLRTDNRSKGNKFDPRDHARA